jgi:hypothetical protein
MRFRLGALLACALLGCSVTPELPPPPVCRHESKDCSSEAIRSRVVGSFSSVKLGEVLACADRPAPFCSSSNADDEACLVRMSPEALAGYSATDVHGSNIPLLVLKLLRGASEQRTPERVFHRQTPGLHGEPRLESIFANTERTLAVLYVAETRCIDISEIT